MKKNTETPPTRSLANDKYGDDDHRLVAALMADDDAAWNYVVTEMITPLVRANVKGIAEMLYRYSIPTDALAGKVFLDLRKSNYTALRNFRFECRFHFMPGMSITFLFFFHAGG